jgi:hypothetical protein
VSPVSHALSAVGMETDAADRPATNSSSAAVLPAAGDFPGNDGSNELTPAANPAPERIPHNVLSPAAPMSLFSPTAGTETVASPSAASSYVEASEALRHDSLMGTEATSPILPSASATSGVERDLLLAERDDLPDDESFESVGGAR